MSYRSYDAVDCKQLDVESLKSKLEGNWGIVAVDDAKGIPYATVYTVDTEATRTEELLKQHTVFRWGRPWQGREVTEMLKSWETQKLEVLLEPSGSYGAGFIERVQEADGMELRQIRGKKTRDSKENYDNVPSMHDAKAADVMARIHMGGGSRPWRARQPREDQLKAVVKQADRLKQERERDRNRLEAELGDVWPELPEQLGLMSTTLLRLVAEYGSPRAMVEEADQARELIEEASRSQIGPRKRNHIIDAARTTAGAWPCGEKLRYMGQIAERLLQLKADIREAERRIESMLEGDEVAERMAQFCGPTAAATLIGEVGDPNDFEVAAAYEKAAGLNLVEDTSGQKGQHSEEDDTPPMRISKRGSSRARKYLYLAIQRWIQRCPVARAWLRYKVARNAGCDGKKSIARVALMRKLIQALYHIGRGADYDASELFDIERLIEKGYPPGKSQST